MLKHNLLLIFRNFKRNKSSFVINLIGLSTGLACALLIYLWVNDELSIDKFNEKDRQLFQVLRNVPNGDGSIDTHETTPVLLAQTMKEELPEVEYAVSVIPHWNETGILSAGDKHIRALPMWVSEDYFNVFSYRLIQGDKK
ncbi:MAG: ABC transporter permease [Mangrovibacterium sp.]